MLTNKLSSKPETMENAHVLVSCIIRKKGSTLGLTVDQEEFIASQIHLFIDVVKLLR